MLFLMWLLHHHDGETSLTKVENGLPKWLTPICISKPSTVLPYGHTITPALLMRTSSLGSPAGQQNGQVVGSTAPCVGISDGQTGLTLVDCFSELSDGLAVCQVQLHAHDILVAWSLHDVFDGCLGSVHVTAGHDDLCPYRVKCRIGG